MEIVFGLSAWLVIPALLLAAGLSFLMYRFKSEELEMLGNRLKWVFVSLRFLVLFVLMLLLLEPLVKSLLTKVEKPVVLVVLDQSASMILGKDSAEVRKGIQPALEKLSNELGDDYQVELTGFDDDLNPKINYDFKGQVTDMGKTTNSIATAYANANLGAIVLVSDGIMNRGENPVYNLRQIKAPVYSVAIGDTTPRLDAAIGNINTNRTAFKGNDFPLSVNIKAGKLKGRSGKVDIIKGGRVLGSQPLFINSDNFSKEYNFTLKADQAGVQQYAVVVSTFEGETVTSNNSRSFFIDVLENREKIALIYAHVHPDVGALAKAIEGIENYELKVAEAANFNDNLADYSLVIFHQTGVADASQKRILDNAQRLGKPLWFFLGPNSDWNYLNNAGHGIKVSGASGQTQVQGRVNETFQLFAGDALDQKLLYDLPPVSVPFGELTCAPSINALYYQQLDRISTMNPLLAFSQTGSRKGFFFGEGIWRWRMASYASTQSTAAFDAMIGRCVQFLTAEGNKKQLLVNTEKYYDASGDVVIGAELYNEAGQFVAGQEILFELTYNDSVTYKYAFNKGAVGYDLLLSDPASGKYAYKASCIYGGKKLTDAGKFIVESSQLELATATADHYLMNQLASSSGGKMIYQKDLQMLPQMIRDNPVVKPISYSSSSVFDAIKVKWICVLIATLLAAEWYLRKRNGLY